MENHPIPQDITGFQFKLIGEMTVKQFAYVAAGVIVGWIIFILPIVGIVKIILSITAVAIGVAFAFVPISGRPMDTMVINFFKAVFSPTQYIYQKIGSNLWVDTTKTSDKKQAPDAAKKLLEGAPKAKVDKKESVFFQNIQEYAADQSAALPEPVKEHMFADRSDGGEELQLQTAPISPKENLQVSEDLAKTAALLEKELAQSKKAEEDEKGQDQKAFLEAHQKTAELQAQLSEMLSQKEELEKRLVELQKNMSANKREVFTPSLATPEEVKETKQARSIPASMAKSAGIVSVPEFPNLLVGILKDPRGNPLSNILVEVKDEEGNAVRAFKTNALGQFASATALTNGKYTISFEDPKSQSNFDTIAFEAKGEIINPIEVISSDQREELRRSLFTN